MEDLKNQIINKAGFLVYTDYWEKYFSKMTSEQIKETLKIVFHFTKTFEILQTNDLAVEMVIATWIDNIKRDAIKRSKQSEASKENGKLGGRPKGKQSIANASKSKQKLANLADSDSKNKKFIRPTLEQIKDYCLERKNNVNPEKWLNHYESKGWKIGNQAMKDWKACIRTWEGKETTSQTIKTTDNKISILNQIAGFEAFKNIEEHEETIYLHSYNVAKVSSLPENIRQKIKDFFVSSNKKLILR